MNLFLDIHYEFKLTMYKNSSNNKNDFQELSSILYTGYSIPTGCQIMPKKTKFNPGSSLWWRIRLGTFQTRLNKKALHYSVLESF